MTADQQAWKERVDKISWGIVAALALLVAATFLHGPVAWTMTAVGLVWVIRQARLMRLARADEPPTATAPSSEL